MTPPPNAPMPPIDAIVAIFGLVLGLAVVRTLPQLVSFYAWFSRSGLKIAEHRGYGQSACKLYGIITAPKLSVTAMALSGVCFLYLVLAPLGLPSAWRAPALGMALVAYHLYFSQVYCEAHVGAPSPPTPTPRPRCLPRSRKLRRPSAPRDAPRWARRTGRARRARQAMQARRLARPWRWWPPLSPRPTRSPRRTATTTPLPSAAALSSVAMRFEAATSNAFAFFAYKVTIPQRGCLFTPPAQELDSKIGCAAALEADPSRSNQPTGTWPPP